MQAGTTNLSRLGLPSETGIASLRWHVSVELPAPGLCMAADPGTSGLYYEMTKRFPEYKGHRPPGLYAPPLQPTPRQDARSPTAMAPVTKDHAAKKDDGADGEAVEQAKKGYKRLNGSVFGRKTGILTNVVVPVLSGIFVWLNARPSNPNPAPAKAFQDCLNSVCGGAEDCVRYSGIGQDEEFFHWVTPFNRAWPLVPTAVVRPRNAEDVSGFVKCAAANNVKVQAKSGGHSYANYGKSRARRGFGILD
ncbi:hypothetical protein LX36DRAFT_663101 [Colletotrichum falcatum]|nr:hypothetical protein LX36DRAFT_663101 [Colletotrichum falcatum]